MLEVLLSRRKRRPAGFKGTADAVRQNLELRDRHQPDLVAVFAADHVYRMDVCQMIDFHAAAGADASVAAVPVPLERACAIGIIAADAGGRIREFRGKPERAQFIEGKPGYA